MSLRLFFSKKLFDEEQTSRKKDKRQPQEGAICFECYWRVRTALGNRCNQIVCSCYCRCVFSLTCEVAIIFFCSLSPQRIVFFFYHFRFTMKPSCFRGLSRKWSSIVLEVRKIGCDEQSLVGSFILVKVLNLSIHWVCNISKHFTLNKRTFVRCQISWQLGEEMIFCWIQQRTQSVSLIVFHGSNSNDEK